MLKQRQAGSVCTAVKSHATAHLPAMKAWCGKQDVSHAAKCHEPVKDTADCSMLAIAVITTQQKGF